MTFREDGEAALEWAARYLERVGEYPVLAQVKPGDPLFALECGAETAARDGAVRRLAEGQAKLEDAKKGRRPVEIESVEAQLKQARAALVLSKKEYSRQDDLYRRGVSSARARLARPPSPRSALASTA